MPSFLYYLPGKTDVKPEDLAAIGYAFKSTGLKHKCVVERNGPDGGHGLIVSDKTRHDSPLNKYVKDRQTWELHEAGGYWVGMWNDQRPTPDVLQRDDMLPGLKVKLGDGNEWVVPMARRWSMEDDPEAWPKAACELPAKIRFVTSGGDAQITYGDIQAKYAHLWALSQAEIRVRYGEATPEDEDMLSGAALYANTLRILQVNYAIGPVECNLLGLFVTGVYDQVFRALNDVENWNTFIEKKTAQLAASQSSSNGQEVTPQSTDQLPVMS